MKLKEDFTLTFILVNSNLLVSFSSIIALVSSKKCFSYSKIG